MYRFNPAKEAATVQIEVLPSRYVVIETEEPDNSVKRHHLFVNKVEKVRPDGKKVLAWDATETGRMWVPPRISEQLTISEGADVSMNLPPIAKVIGSRSVEEARGKKKPRELGGESQKVSAVPA